MQISIFTFILIDAQASELSESETSLIITLSISDLSLTSCPSEPSNLRSFGLKNK